MAKAKFTQPPTADFQKQVADPKYVPPGVVTQGTDAGLSENGYVNVDPIYQNHANDTEAPIKAEGSPEAKLMERHYADDVDFDSTGPEEGAADDDDEDDDDEEDEASSSTSSTTPPPTTSSTTPPPSGSNS